MYLGGSVHEICCYIMTYLENDYTNKFKRIFVLNVRFICVQKICFYVTTNVENEYSKIFKKDFCTQREIHLRTKNVFLCHDKYANLVTLYQVTIHFE